MTEYGNVTQPPKILVTGMTSLRLNAMEFDNLGNFIIIEPLFRTLRDEFRNSVIMTTLQLTDEFSSLYGIQVIKDEYFWDYGSGNTLKAVADLVGAFVWAVLRKVGINWKGIISRSARLKAVDNCDFVVDFSGDLLGDNALNWKHLLTGVLVPLTTKLLGKKIFLIASSPGPFKKVMRLVLTVIALKCYDLVSVREPLSLCILNSLGLTQKKICMHPCFSYGFKPINPMQDEDIYAREPRLRKCPGSPLIGFIICNLNMRSKPANKWPRDEQEYAPFVELITYLTKEIDAKVCVFSHRNKLDVDGGFVPGSDHSIVKRLIELLPDDVRENVFTLNGVYDASNINKIIGNFDILISGRIHGAVQGIMQYIPTMIMDYAMPPKAHKLKGFALSCGLYDYVSDSTDGRDMKRKFAELWNKKDYISKDLEDRIPQLIDQSKSLWSLIHKCFKLNGYKF